MAQYDLSPEQERALMRFMRRTGGYSVTNDLVAHEGYIKDDIKTKAGNVGVLFGFKDDPPSGVPSHYWLATTDPKIMKYLEEKGIRPSELKSAVLEDAYSAMVNRNKKGQSSDSSGESKDFQITPQMYLALMTALGPNFAESPNGMYIVEGKNAGERRIKGAEAERNNGMASVASVYKEPNPFNRNPNAPPLSVTIHTANPRIIEEIAKIRENAVNTKVARAT